MGIFFPPLGENLDFIFFPPLGANLDFIFFPPLGENLVFMLWCALFHPVLQSNDTMPRHDQYSRLPFFCRKTMKMAYSVKSLLISSVVLCPFFLSETNENGLVSEMAISHLRSKAELCPFFWWRPMKMAYFLKWQLAIYAARNF